MSEPKLHDFNREVPSVTTKESQVGKVAPRPENGAAILLDPFHNKGLAFSLKERQMLNVHGLLPPRTLTQAEQVDKEIRTVRKFSTNIEKYLYLRTLQDRNRKLFYRLARQYIDEITPLVYTPTVGEACQKFSAQFGAPRGLFITINDLGHVAQIIRNWPQADVEAVVVTDGERILGLGDLGVNGHGIPVGKLSLYSACAGFDPRKTLPVTLDVGTDNEELLKDPDYLGLRQRRDRSLKYDMLIQEFIDACKSRFGDTVLIQFEDFGNRNAFRLLHEHQQSCCCFNDDIQGTAAVALGGIFASTRISQRPLEDEKFVFFGAGEAAIGIAGLIVSALEKKGISTEAARKTIFMIDSRGLIVKNRSTGGISDHKAPFAQEMEEIPSSDHVILDVVKKVNPTCLIGVAAQPRVFTEEICKLMAANHARPVIMALSNPTSKAECTAEQAYTWTEGRAVFASGSPFDAVEYQGKTFQPGQGNNVYIFPGVALGAVAVGALRVTDEMFLAAAETLASLVPQDRIDVGCLYPSLGDVLSVSLAIAEAVAKIAIERKLTASQPEDVKQRILAHMYSHDYESYIPDVYDWPESHL